MSWKMKAETGFVQPPTGPQPAVLTRIIDIGTHTDTSPIYGMQTKRQVVFMWELAEMMDDRRPFTIQVFYTLSMSEKANLRKMLEAWRGKSFDVGEDVELDIAMGKSCLLNIGETDKGKSKVMSVSRLPKGVPNLEPVGPLLVFRLDEPDWAAYEQLSEFHQRKVSESEEWAKLRGPATQPAPAPASDWAPRAARDDDDRRAHEATQPPAGGVPLDDLDDDIPF